MTYGLPRGTRIGRGAAGFPTWVYQLGSAFGLSASTYEGHQETNRAEAGYAPNPQHLNRGIDWWGPVDALQRFADYLLSIRGSLEQVIWEHPTTGRRVGVAGGRDVTGSAYYDYDGGYNAHRNHVHTRQSAPIPLPGKPITQEVPVGWTGDPVWLADVVRPAVDKFVEYPGWRDRGHGDFKDIRGVMVHHTGGPASAASIAEGRPDLAGPLSQLHIARDGTVTVVAAGVAWHAGSGSYPWLPANMGNWHLIGIECEWPYVGGVTERTQYQHPWNRPQILALRNTVAAILLKLRYGADRAIGHEEYAGRAQGKWDPGNMAMDWLRGEVDQDMRGFVFPGESGPRPVPPVTPPPLPAPVPPVDKYAGVLLYRGMSGPAVVKLQQRLKAVIVSQLVVDGDFGPKTEAAVRAFQASQYRRPPLAVDGVVGPATAAQLGLVL